MCAYGGPVQASYPATSIVSTPSAGAGHANLEARGGIEMPVMQKAVTRHRVHMIKLTETREITPYVWVHPDEDRRRRRVVPC